MREISLEWRESLWSLRGSSPVVPVFVAAVCCGAWPALHIEGGRQCSEYNDDVAPGMFVFGRLAPDFCIYGGRLPLPEADCVLGVRRSLLALRLHLLGRWAGIVSAGAAAELVAGTATAGCSSAWLPLLDWLAAKLEYNDTFRVWIRVERLYV
jgi:hypothetical protein